MNIEFSYDKEFCDLMTNLKTKYGEKLFELDGIGERQLDINSFSKQYYNNRTTTADVSIDSNANISQMDVITYMHEMPKPFFKLNSYYILWKKLRQLYNTEEANKILTMQIKGDIYIHDAWNCQMSYCWNMSAMNVALMGLKMLKNINCVPPKSLYSFKSQIEQTIVIVSNSILGACGISDLFIVMSYYVDKILKTGEDCHFKFKSEEDIWIYVAENITSFVYTVNQNFRSNQSPFTNVSVYDDVFLDNLIEDYKFPDDELGQVTPKKETVKRVQKIFLEVMNTELSRGKVTFPVTTACLSLDENGDINDENFVQMVAEQNGQFGFINFFCGKSTMVSSCCRLRSDTESPYMNNFGVGSKVQIGSIGVVTLNLPRLALVSKTKETFLENIKKYTKIAGKINHAKRSIIKKRIMLGTQPLYTFGYMNIDNQYNTVGINGLYEAIQILGEDIIKNEGLQLAKDTIDTINSVNERLQKQYQTAFNAEQVPSENASIKLAKKDKLLGYDIGIPFYANQWVPLTTKADVLDRIRISGELDNKMSGGSILHVNLDEKIEDTQKIIDIIKTCAKQKVIYFALNYLLNLCENKHMSVGNNTTCPICKAPITNTYSRVVGFLIDLSNSAQERRKHDFPHRQQYKGI